MAASPTTWASSCFAHDRIADCGFEQGGSEEGVSVDPADAR